MKPNLLHECLKKHGVTAQWRPYMADCGDGWVPLIDTLITELLKLGWDRELHQIKEKFGGLRFYVGDATPEMYALICAAEDASLKTCEHCGAPGKLDKTGWWKTVCPEHDQNDLRGLG